MRVLDQYNVISSELKGHAYEENRVGERDGAVGVGGRTRR